MIDEFVDDYNNRPLADFDGLSPADMHRLLYGSFNDSVIHIIDHHSAVDEIPFVRMIAALLEEINADSGLKLTASGYLPLKTVRTLYDLRILGDEPIDFGITKLRSESDTLTIRLTRIIAELAGYIRKTHGRLYRTKKGRNFRNQRNVISSLISTFGEKYNLAYFDGYASDQIAQIGYRYSLYLLKKYGEQPRDSSFYSDRYFRAFPSLRTGSASDDNCYRLRTFDRFLSYFGFAFQEGTNNSVIQKTLLLDKHVEFSTTPDPGMGQGRSMSADPNRSKN